MITDKQSPRYAEVMEFLKSSAKITTGVHAAEGVQSYEGGATVLDIAEAAEFGLGQPMRSWLRGWFDEHQAELEAQILAQFTLAYERGLPQEWAAERVALWAQASIQRRVRNGIDPPNAPETIKRKGSSTPLIDTGLFRSAIVSYVAGKRVTS